MLSRQGARQADVRAPVVQQELHEFLVDAAAAAATATGSPVRAVPRVRNAGAAIVINALHIRIGLENGKRADVRECNSNIQASCLVLTHIRSWTMGRLPSDVARCRGVLASRGLIGAFTSS